MTNPSQEKTLRDEFAMAAPPMGTEFHGKFYQFQLPERYWGWKNKPESEFMCRSHNNPNPNADGYVEKNQQAYWDEYNAEALKSLLMNEAGYRYAFADAMLAERMK